MSSHGPAERADADDAGSAPPGAGFGFLLRRHRRDAGLTQEELAERSGLSVRAIRDLERGRARTPQRESVKALVAALGLAGSAAVPLERAARAGRNPRPGPSPLGPAERCELPSGVADFAGRSAELAGLHRAVELADVGGGRPAGTVVISAILGQAGIGKTALALRLAHELAEEFPDAQLYVDLRGTDDPPTDPAEVLGRFLSALGLPQRLIPTGLEERAARYRALLFRRRALVVLDNAADEAQVRPLLPGSPQCLVLVTSRNVLAGLETPHRLLLDVLTAPEAVGLLNDIVGDRARAEPAAVADVAELCGYLPLALRIVGNRLTSRPAWTLAFLADRLRDERARLALLQAGDLQVRAAFAMSYGQASPAAQQLFRLLSLVPGPDFGSGLAAVLAGTGEVAADTVLDELADASLILPAAQPGRYRMHDLMRLFAGEMLAAEDDEDTRLTAQEQMVHWLLSTATLAGTCFFLPAAARLAAPGSVITTRASAAAWLEAERANWTAAVRYAAGHRPRTGSWSLAELGLSVGWYHNMRGRWDQWREVCEMALESVRGSGRPAEATFLMLLVDALAHTGRSDEALRYAAETLELASRRGNERQLAWALEVTARAYRSSGRFEEAAEQELQALDLFRAAGNRLEQAIVLDGLGLTLGQCGRFEEAERYHRDAVEVATEVLDETHVAVGLVSLSETLMAEGKFAEAVDSLQQALAVLAPGGDAWREGLALQSLGRALQELGRFTEAADALRRAALVFAETGDRYDRAGVLEALGVALSRLGEVEQARECWRESLEIYERLDVPEAGRLRRLLAGSG